MNGGVWAVTIHVRVDVFVTCDSLSDLSFLPAVIFINSH